MLLKNEIFNLQATDGNRARYWYRCRNEGCECDSPTRETAEEAYKAAMKRRQEPNRVLTLDEVLEIACDDYNTEQETVMYLEYREDYEGYAIVTDLETDGSKILLEFSGIGGGGKQNEKDYGSLWRCWRRKPTKNERENTPWEDEGR
jgi:hypothetical protein